MPPLTCDISAVRFNTYNEFFSQYKLDEQKKHFSHLQRTVDVKEKYETFTENNESTCTGMDQLNKFFFILADIENIYDIRSGEKEYLYALSADQKKYAYKFIVTLIPKIFTQSEINKELPSLMKKLNFYKFFPVTCLTTPRRFGKTHLVSVIALCCCIALRTIEKNFCKVLSFSPGQRSSSHIIDNVKKLITALYPNNTKEMIPEFSKTKYIGVKNSWGGVSLIEALPSNSSIGV